ncbi:transcriptional regulator [Brevibacterium casei]|uniref:Transcriptional regulator n=1 Tax=Brevibacterium casei TaxID=33889 RepID=A0A7T3ZZM4_9MICO|nr:transcriptional regulator [Brevibacterium casei]
MTETPCPVPGRSSPAFSASSRSSSTRPRSTGRSARDTTVPDAEFNPLIHAPIRLRISAMLSQAKGIEFGEIQSRLDISKSALSKHLSQLIDAGYVDETSIVRLGRSRQWLSLTPAGLSAYRSHLAALRSIIDADD